MLAIPPVEAPIERISAKVRQLQASLVIEAVHLEAVAIPTLIESVTIYPSGNRGPEAEGITKVADLVALAINDNAARVGGDCSSMALVAGTGFEPVTFRL